MKLIQTLTALACLAPFSIALASNPAICMSPEALNQAARVGAIYDIEPAVSKGKIVPHRWYSVGKGEYSRTMELLVDRNNQWAHDNGSDNEDSNGVLCSYYSKEANANVYIQLFYQKPKR